VVYREPQPLSIFAQGVDLASGEKKTLFIYYMLREVMENKGADPFLLADFGFGTVDFLFIIKVIISLLVIFFAYDIVSGEKERGTLKLSLSNSLPRWILMLGKMLSGLGVVTMFLAVSLLVAALIVAFHPDVHFSVGDWIRVLIIFGVSLMYLSVFFTLSAMVSIIANSAAVTLLILVQLWVMIAIVIPGGGALMAQTAHPTDIPNLQETDKQVQAVADEYRKKIDALGAVDTNEKAYTQDSLDNESNEALVARVYMPLSNALTREAEKIQNAMMISPAGLYERIVLRLARTDFEEYDYFQKGVFVYWKMSSTDRLNRIFKKNLPLPGKIQAAKEPVFSYRSEGI
jgi:ABC-type transport system involved in multi-copper enzyme maturation permease subunit